MISTISFEYRVEYSNTPTPAIALATYENDVLTNKQWFTVRAARELVEALSSAITSAEGDDD